MCVLRRSHAPIGYDPLYDAAMSEKDRQRLERAVCALSEDGGAPSASRDHLKAQAAPTQPEAPPEQLRGLLRPGQLAPGRPKGEGSPLSTTRTAGSCG